MLERKLPLSKNFDSELEIMKTRIILQNERLSTDTNIEDEIWSEHDPVETNEAPKSEQSDLSLTEIILSKKEETLENTTQEETSVLGISSLSKEPEIPEEKEEENLENESAEESTNYEKEMRQLPPKNTSHTFEIE